MTLESFDHAEESSAKRALVEARNEADAILAAVERATSSPVCRLLSAEEQVAISIAKDELVAVRQEQDPKIIRDATLKLDQATRHLAELLMDAAVARATARQNPHSR
jgi:molecular chaperone DnaK (HSP70)